MLLTLVLLSTIGAACTQADLTIPTVQYSSTAKAQAETSVVAPARPTPTIRPLSDPEKSLIPSGVIPSTSTPVVASPNWPAATRKAFEDFVANGGGFVAVHAADNSFPLWKEYNRMIGIGGDNDGRQSRQSVQQPVDACEWSQRIG